MPIRLVSALCAGLFSLGLVSTVGASSLSSRLGGLAWYDDDLDITWAADANINGLDTWGNQVAWAAGLTIGGISGWRLPSADVNGDGTLVDCFFGGVTGCADNEMGYLYWEEGIRPTTPGPFSNIQSFSYWSSTEFVDVPGAVWFFRINNGGQGAQFADSTMYAWAVRSGDVSVVPIPAAVWLFGSGLLGLVGIARRKKAA